MVAPTIAYGDWRDPIQVADEDLRLAPQLTSMLDAVSTETGEQLAPQVVETRKAPACVGANQQPHSSAMQAAHHLPLRIASPTPGLPICLGWRSFHHVTRDL